MPQWIIVAALLSVLATVWLAWLLWRVNVGPQSKRKGGGDGGAHVYADGGGKSRHDNDATDGGSSDGGSDGGGGDGGGGGGD